MGAHETETLLCTQGHCHSSEKAAYRMREKPLLTVHLAEVSK